MLASILPPPQQSLTTENHLAQNVNSATKVEKHCIGHINQNLHLHKGYPLLTVLPWSHPPFHECVDRVYKRKGKENGVCLPLPSSRRPHSCNPFHDFPIFHLFSHGWHSLLWCWRVHFYKAPFSVWISGCWDAMMIGCLALLTFFYALSCLHAPVLFMF